MIKNIFKKMIILFLLLSLWSFISISIQSNLFPEPISIIEKVYSNLESIKMHLLYSILRLVSSLLITSIIGISLGILLASNQKLNKALSPIVYMSYPVPKMALLPFIMLIFGFGEATKITMIILITVFTVIINVRDEVLNIDSDVFDVMISLGSTRSEIIKNIVLPAVLPTILTSLRISLGISLSVLFFVENYGTKYGLGYSIMDYWMRADYAGVYASVIMISLLGIIIYKFIDLIESKVCSWKRKDVS